MGYGIEDIDEKHLPNLNRKEKAKIYDSLIKAVQEGYSIEIKPGPEGRNCPIKFSIIIKFDGVDMGFMNIDHQTYSFDNIDEYISSMKRYTLTSLSKKGEGNVQGS